MRYVITKEFSFSASHQLGLLPDGHPCARLHGHNYKVKLTFAAIGRLQPPGFVIDYNALKPFQAWLDDNVDHRNLNDVVLFQPTAERLAEYFYDIAFQLLPSNDCGVLVEAAVSETDKTWATFQP